MWSGASNPGSIIEEEKRERIVGSHMEQALYSRRKFCFSGSHNHRTGWKGNQEVLPLNSWNIKVPAL
jgi:hypothetical protein